MKDKNHYDGGMSLKEAEYIKYYMQKNNPIVLEWGMGTSTKMFPQYCKKYISIEHDKSRFNKINDVTKKQTNLTKYHIKQNHPRTNPTQYAEFKNYIEFAGKFEDEFFDLFFADGRARVYCLNYAKPKLKKDGLIFLHDYNEQKRPHYSWIKDFTTKIDQVDYLGVFKYNE